MLLRGYNRVLRTQLCLPRLSSSSKAGKLKELKKALSAPMERKLCCWTSQLSRLSRFQRMSVAMSLFLFRKVLPPEDPSIESFLEKISTPSPAPDPEFLDFAGRLVDKIFEDGWDAGYGRAVELASIGTSACEEGGATRLRYMEAYGNEARDMYKSVCLGEVPLPSETHTARVKRIFTAGKYRIISIPSMDHHHLRPLHNVLYDHLSRQGWLLRGDAVAKRFLKKSAPFLRLDGEVFVSGDYESATDNLNNHVQSFLLERVLSHCGFVPQSVCDFAVRSLSPTLTYDGRSYEMKSGQMMGFLLSFPLLCLVNYVTFKFFVRRPVPVRINGDDIVFRASREEFEIWAAGVSRSGLTLSLGKTMVSRSYFTLNSTLFRATRASVSAVPFVRSKALFGVEDQCSSPAASLSGRLKSFCVGFSGAARDVWMELFLKYNRGYIKKMRCSIARGLGVPLSKAVLQSANLWDRECAYLTLPVEKPPPLPFSEWSNPPEGYELAWSSEPHVYDQDEKSDLASAFAAAAWKPPRTMDEYRDDIKGALNPVPMSSLKFSRLAGITFSSVREILSARRDAVYASYLKSLVPRCQYWRKSSPRLASSGPLCGVHQVDEKREPDAMIPPPESLLLGVKILEGEGPRAPDRSWSRFVRGKRPFPFATRLNLFHDLKEGCWSSWSYQSWGLERLFSVSD